MSDYIQLWVPDRDGCMEPSEDRGYVTLEDHLAAVQALVLSYFRQRRECLPVLCGLVGRMKLTWCLGWLTWLARGLTP